MFTARTLAGIAMTLTGSPVAPRILYWTPATVPVPATQKALPSTVTAARTLLAE